MVVFGLGSLASQTSKAFSLALTYTALSVLLNLPLGFGLISLLLAPVELGISYVYFRLLWHFSDSLLCWFVLLPLGGIIVALV